MTRFALIGMLTVDQVQFQAVWVVLLQLYSAHCFGFSFSVVSITKSFLCVSKFKHVYLSERHHRFLECAIFIYPQESNEVTFKNGLRLRVRAVPFKFSNNI